MDFQRIESFLALARTLNYTKASQAVFKTQSVISRHIFAMEEELGVKLFNRTKRNVELTHTGKVLAAGFKRIMEMYDSIVSEAQAVSNGYKGELKICCQASQSVGERLGLLLVEFAKEYPDINVHLCAKSMGDIKYSLQENQIDIICGRAEDFNYTKDLKEVHVAEIDAGVVVSKRHPLAGQNISAMAEEDLDRYTLIWSRDLESEFVSKFISRRKGRMGTGNVIYAPDLNSLLLLIETGKGFSLLNENNYINGNSTTIFSKVCFIAKTQECIMWRDVNTNPCLKTFVEFCKNYQRYLHIT